MNMETDMPDLLRRATRGTLNKSLIALALVLLGAGGMVLSQRMTSQADVPTRAAAPAAVELPPDVAAFLKQVGDAYGSADFADLPQHFSNDFLYQGMSRTTFIDHLKDERKYLGKLTIIPISFKADGEAATVIAYAVSPRGVVAPSMQLLPLNIGATLVKQNGAWKLRGNQRQEEAALYRQLAGISADFRPSDMDAYKRLIPAGYSIPDQPYVRIALTNWLDMEPPQTPYRLVTLSILVRRNEENIWYIVAMPETDWVAVKAGNAVGFPKFVTDIEVERSFAGRATASVREEGRPLVNLSFEPDADAKPEAPRAVDAWLLVDKNQDEIRAWMTPLGEASSFKQRTGWMTVNTIASPWKELVAPGSKAAASAMDLTMGLKLNMVPFLHQPNRGEAAPGA
jgi:hypothetical protein